MNRRKLMLTVLILAAAAAAIIAGIFLIRSRSAAVPVESGIVRVYYSRGGGELGDSYILELSDGRISEESCEGNGAKTYKRKAKAGQAVYDSIEAVAEEYGVKAWKDLPQEEEFALDAPSTYFAIDFSDGSGIHVDSQDILPGDGWQGVNRIRELMEEQLK